MGGELTGTIDESVRHAITKLSHLHFVATEQSKVNILQMGESEEYVHTTGCPRIDFARTVLSNDKKYDLPQRINEIGVGSPIDLFEPFVILALHPVTTEWKKARSQIEISLQAAKALELPTIVVWPNADAGTSEMARGIRSWRETKSTRNFRFVSDLSPQDFFQLMAKCALMIGNSSAGIREGSYIGTPFLNLGSRQLHRECSSNTTHSDWRLEEIIHKAKIMLERGRFETSNLYGDGFASQRIVSLVNELHPNIQKNFTKRQVVT
jgi:UDP-hydrolysing UDP-N-acetyl-D-glucosamine 2-epimerase